MAVCVLDAARVRYVRALFGTWYLTWLCGWKECIVCGVAIWSAGDKKVCSERCQYLKQVGWITAGTGCGDELDRRKIIGKRLCCTCLDASKKVSRKRLKAIHNKQVSSAAVERVSRHIVFAKGRYHCWICLGICKRKYDATDPASPTVDHAIPLSNGGEHSYENCRCAHAICNSLKSDNN